MPGKLYKGSPGDLIFNVDGIPLNWQNDRIRGIVHQIKLYYRGPFHLFLDSNIKIQLPQSYVHNLTSKVSFAMTASRRA